MNGKAFSVIMVLKRILQLIMFPTNITLKIIDCCSCTSDIFPVYQYKVLNIIRSQRLFFFLLYGRLALITCRILSGVL